MDKKKAEVSASALSDFAARADHYHGLPAHPTVEEQYRADVQAAAARGCTRSSDLNPFWERLKRRCARKLGWDKG